MRIAIFGAGAIGGYLGALLEQAGAEVSLIARGQHLAAMRKEGIRLISEDKEYVARLQCTDNAAELGEQDYVLVCLKAGSVSDAAESIYPLLGPHTSVVTCVNGIPYWYFHCHGGSLENRIVESVDPGGRLWRTLGPERAIGCVVYPAAEVVAPGVVKHVYGNKFPLGEPSGDDTPRVKRLAEQFSEAGLKAPICERIRDELWLKLWGNLSFNPISALTHATLDVIASDTGTRGVVKKMMLEAQAIAERLGVSFRVSIDRRIEGARRVGAHKTSMLQDLERGRPLEVEALVGAVQELGQMTGLPTPTIDVVLALIRQRSELAMVS